MRLEIEEGDMEAEDYKAFRKYFEMIGEDIEDALKRMIRIRLREMVQEAKDGLEE